MEFILLVKSEEVFLGSSRFESCIFNLLITRFDNTNL